MSATAITLSGNLVADAELRYTPTGVPVANFRVASTERFKGTDGWQDGDTIFMSCTAWRDLAGHVAESAAKGTRVIVTGRIKQRTYERDGSNVTVTEIEASDVGISLQRATVKITKTERSQGEAGNGGPGAGDEPPF